MKPVAALIWAAIFSSSQVYSMTMVGTGSGAASATQSQALQSGKVDAIHAGASRLVIGGVTYEYNPLTTTVMVNGKRATVSDVRSGETVQFQASPQGANKPALLTSINVQRQ
ncbi:hypothetical protein [Thiobacillus sp.]